jgi:phosphatidylserine/phosphatidylglycerophosphate/cardiolipin synthase-like enzyme
LIPKNKPEGVEGRQNLRHSHEEREVLSMKYLVRYLLVGLIGTTILSLYRHGILDHVWNSGPSLTSFHLPQFGRTVSAAVGQSASDFHYGPNENLERLDVQAIDRAEGHIDVAMYSFTNHAIADALVAAAKRGVQIRIYRDFEQYEEEQRRGDTYVAQALASNQNISIRVKGVKELMHLKEWSDGNQLREGSANWSVAGERRQDNSVAFYEDKQGAAIFERKFQMMWDRPDNMRVQ